MEQQHITEVQKKKPVRSFMWEPKDHPQFKGWIKVRVPTMPERFSYQEQVSWVVDQDGKVAAPEKQIGAVKRAVEISAGHYEEVKLQHIESGVEYESFEDLTLDPECDAVLTEVAGLVLRGFGLSKK
jgi:hypothetical protein